MAADAKPWLHPRSRRFIGDISEAPKPAAGCWILLALLEDGKVPTMFSFDKQFFSFFRKLVRRLHLGIQRITPLSGNKETYSRLEKSILPVEVLIAHS